MSAPYPHDDGHTHGVGERAPTAGKACLVVAMACLAAAMGGAAYMWRGAGGAWVDPRTAPQVRVECRRVTYRLAPEAPGSQSGAREATWRMPMPMCTRTCTRRCIDEASHCECGAAEPQGDERRKLDAIPRRLVLCAIYLEIADFCHRLAIAGTTTTKVPES